MTEAPRWKKILPTATKALRVFVGGVVALAAMTVPAHAELVSLTTMIHGFLLASTAIPAAMTGVIATALSIGISTGAPVGGTLVR